MSYIETILEPGETVYYQAKLSLWKFAIVIFAGFFSILIGLIPGFPVGFLYIGTFFLVSIYIAYTSTELAITNKHILSKTGFIRRDTNEILLEKAESIKIKQSIFGRMFNYGNVFVIGTGGTIAPMKYISKPLEFRKKFTQMKNR